MKTIILVVALLICELSLANKFDEEMAYQHVLHAKIFVYEDLIELKAEDFEVSCENYDSTKSPRHVLCDVSYTVADDSNTSTKLNCSYVYSYSVDWKTISKSGECTK